MIIKINLALKKNSTGPVVPITTGSGFSVQSLLAKLKASRGGGSVALTPETKTLAVQIILLLLISYAGNYYVTDYKDKQLRTLDSSRSDLHSKLKLIDSEIGKTAGYEKLKRDLEGDELQLKKKIETIQRVITNRSDAPKILLRVSDVIPKNVWLTDIRVEEKSVKMSGIAISYEDYADFSKKLEGIELFSKVTSSGGISQIAQDSVQVYRFGLDIVRR